MKTLFLAASLLLAAGAEARTECQGLGHAAKLSYNVLSTRIGARILATLTSAEGAPVKLSGLQRFDQETQPDIYELIDEDQKSATLKVSLHTRRLPCGRGSCDIDSIPVKRAELTYLGSVQSFSCHDVAGF